MYVLVFKAVGTSVPMHLMRSRHSAWEPVTQMPVCFEIFVVDSSAKHEKHVVTWEKILVKPGCRQPQAVIYSLQLFYPLAADGLSVQV